MKHLISRRNFLKAAGVTTAAAAMAVGAPAASACWTGEKSEVTILYTNDVHTYIDKQAPELTYAAIAALKQSYQNAGKKVLLVDAGDHVQGTAYGSMDQGASIIELMNAAGYDAATPGNHEFDYGMDRAKELMRDADFPYLSCNWAPCRPYSPMQHPWQGGASGPGGSAPWSGHPAAAADWCSVAPRVPTGVPALRTLRAPLQKAPALRRLPAAAPAHSAP